mmetsp:Transcript_18890/g.29635  ORF Transcript_18890/g.29635 Transcript_18890/m.29635 type:complete len:80 (+) Transcript_18890:109-348(+)
MASIIRAEARENVRFDERERRMLVKRKMERDCRRLSYTIPSTSTSSSSRSAVTETETPTTETKERRRENSFNREKLPKR